MQKIKNKIFNQKNGLLYPPIAWVFEKMRYLNLVELCKHIATKNKEDAISSSRNAVDLFIIFRWIILIVFWNLETQNTIAVFFIWYLYLMNVYTYFYYHVWSSEALKEKIITEERARRRFITLLMAIAFSVISFAYLCQVPYARHFKPTESISIISGFLEAIDNVGRYIIIINLVVNFFFLTIIVSKSIPKISAEE